jgi:predicted transcriptional regulator
LRPPVVENGATMGVVGVTDIVKGLSEGGQAVEVGKVMRRDFATADPAEGLDDVVRRLQDVGRGPVLVLDAGHLVGMITAENIGEIVMLRTALESRRPDG